MRTSAGTACSTADLTKRLPMLLQLAVKGHRAFQITTERLLDDEARPALLFTCQACLAELSGNQAEHDGRYGEVKQVIAPRLMFGINLIKQSGEPLIGGWVFEVTGQIVEATNDRIPDPLVERVPRGELADVLAHLLPERVVIHVVQCGADERDVVGEQAGAGAV